MKTHLSICLFFLFLFSCNDLTEMDLLDDPNSIKPDQTDIELLNNSIQLSFKDFQYELHLIADGIVRYTSLNAFSYQDALRAEVGDKAWHIAFSELLPDIEFLISIAVDKELNIYEGRAKILKSYVLTTLVDFFVDIPIVELKHDLTFSPELVEGSIIYEGVDKLLDDAISLLSEEGIEPASDLYYEGNNEKWVKLAWTLKLRNALYTSRVRNNLDVIFEIVNNQDLIESNEESFLFRFGKERDDPPSRHPLYDEYYGNGSREYLGNYFMWTLTSEKLNERGSRIYDPRSGLYLYRQFFKIDDLENEGVLCYHEVYSRELQIPDHYKAVDPNLPYCVASVLGHYGRDHGNGNPDQVDQDFRTAYGLYPIGGKWDGFYFDKLSELEETGGKGQGILPIIRASSVDFMKAEASLIIGSGENTRELLASGIRKSIEEALEFTDLDPTIFTDILIDPVGPALNRWEVFGVTEINIERYIEYVLDQYDSSNDKLDVIMKEAYISRWGNAVETYNACRRTGKPNNMQPGIDPDLIGGFPKSLLRPSIHVNRNANVKQKSLQDLVFWDPGGIICR